MSNENENELHGSTNIWKPSEIYAVLGRFWTFHYTVADNNKMLPIEVHIPEKEDVGFMDVDKMAWDAVVRRYSHDQIADTPRIYATPEENLPGSMYDKLPRGFGTVLNIVVEHASE